MLKSIIPFTMIVASLKGTMPLNKAIIIEIDNNQKVKYSTIEAQSGATITVKTGSYLEFDSLDMKNGSKLVYRKRCYCDRKKCGL